MAKGRPGYKRGHEGHTQVRVRLDSKSIQNAINEVEEYEKKIKGAGDAIRAEIAKRLEQKITEKMLASPYDIYVGEGGGGAPHFDVTVGEKNTVITVSGEQAIFVEFGAGAKFNKVGSIPNPNAPPWVKPIGSYGSGRGKQQMWVIERRGGEPILTYGTPASMPIYHSVEEVKAEMSNIIETALGKVGTP